MFFTETEREFYCLAPIGGGDHCGRWKGHPDGCRVMDDDGGIGLAIAVAAGRAALQVSQNLTEMKEWYQ